MAVDVALIGVGVALAALVIGAWRDLKGDISKLRDEMHGMRGDMHTLGERVARIEGRLDERDHHTTPPAG